MDWLFIPFAKSKKKTSNREAFNCFSVKPSDGKLKMTEKIMSHELARMLLEQPNQVVMVNGDHNACETTELTHETFELGRKEDGDCAGGRTDADRWVKLGR
ncbi:hypothetical protein JR728_004496 [Vibrio vulnificus]|nr:hypothetical protein [Vibrio vulnificus]